jgi:ABC-type anion transport system duplicated permease subunit
LPAGTALASISGEMEASPGAYRLGRTLAMRTLMVSWILFALLLVGLSATVGSSDETTLVADLTAADHEVDEGYFALGQKTTVVAQPGSPLHAWLSSHRGQRVRVLITTADPNSDSQ